MEVSQFTYFQQVCGIECAPVAGELTYGLERLAMYVQGVDNVYDLNFNGLEGADKVTYGDVFLQAEQEYSRHNFEYADTAMLLRHFDDAEKECNALLAAGARAGEGGAHKMVLPAYDQAIKASHVFNLLTHAASSRSPSAPATSSVCATSPCLRRGLFAYRSGRFSVAA